MGPALQSVGKGMEEPKAKEGFGADSPHVLGPSQTVASHHELARAVCALPREDRSSAHWELDKALGLGQVRGTAQAGS